MAKPAMSTYTPSTGWKKAKVRREWKFIVGGVVQTASGSRTLVILATDQGSRAGAMSAE